jgi:hypothetical protein
MCQVCRAALPGRRCSEQHFPNLLVSKQKLRRADAIACVRMKRHEACQNLGFASRPFVLCGLPVKRPHSGQFLHERRNGHFFASGNRASLVWRFESYLRSRTCQRPSQLWGLLQLFTWGLTVERFPDQIEPAARDATSRHRANPALKSDFSTEYSPGGMVGLFLLCVERLSSQLPSSLPLPVVWNAETQSRRYRPDRTTDGAQQAVPKATHRTRTRFYRLGPADTRERPEPL